MICSCKCMNCKSTELKSNEFIASDGYNDIHHTCLDCNLHFNHLDGEQFQICKICKYDKRF